ncbi:hypothetical protein ZIOFF_022099 [Zingiber officinale]|uniref:Uncharacterized protein n=1 Tax=Zingiber officinale TaxID=94328 RepID=A0A8J5H2K5_ZINOF|nr:hypothetical protein ZIOFF_022099 [Zingiber officinale]
MDNNLLSGSIPDFLGNLPNLRELNLAYNQLSGRVPESLLSNNKLNLNLTGNPLLTIEEKHMPHWKKAIWSVIAVVVIIVVVGVCCCSCHGLLSLSLLKSRSRQRDEVKLTGVAHLWFPHLERKLCRISCALARSSDSYHLRPVERKTHCGFGQEQGNQA